MAQKKITDLQLVDQFSDDLNLPVDDTIQTYRATGTQLKTYLAPIYLPPSIRKFTTGSGTYNKSYTFIVSGVTASAGATYTHNAITYTVLNSVSSSNAIVLHGSAAPLASGSLTLDSGTGDASISFGSVRAPVYLRVRLVGGGGGGAGSSTNAAANGGTGAVGGNTTFGTSMLVGYGGGGGSGSTLGGGAGGTSTLGSGPVGTNLSGSPGGAGGQGPASVYLSGATGGASAFSGGGSGGVAGGGGAGPANTGGGGGGGGTPSTAEKQNNGSGGGAGGFVDAVIYTPNATYAYAVGAGGAGGAAGTSGYAGGAGAAGYIEISEHYQ